jgi:hypothetical protein
MENNKIKEKFIKDWGEELANKIEEAANYHRNGVNDQEIGDPFKWALLICIGYHCLENKEYRKFHGIPNLNWRKLKKWIRDNAELESYKGDLDYISLFCGVYNYYLKRPLMFLKNRTKGRN